MPMTPRQGHRRKLHWCSSHAGRHPHRSHRRSRPQLLLSNPFLGKEVSQLLSTLIESHIPSPLNKFEKSHRHLKILNAKDTSVLDMELPPYSPPVTINICKYQNILTQIKTKLTDLGYPYAVYATCMIIPVRSIIDLDLQSRRYRLPVLLQKGKVFSFNLIKPKKRELCDQFGGAFKMTPSEDK